jgi:ribosomal protein L37E
MSEEIKCERCGKGSLVLGTLEGVSFVPVTNKRRLITKGIYGLTALACSECGWLTSFKVDPAALKKLVEGKR